MKYEFQRRRVDKISESRILDEMEKAAERFHFVDFGERDFNRVATISATTVKRYFGSWRNGLRALEKQLHEKGKGLKPRPHPPNRLHSDIELFSEMERVWHMRGQRPSRAEWEASQPRISFNTFKRRFGGWNNACLRFIEHKMKMSISEDEFVLPSGEDAVGQDVARQAYRAGDSRTVPLALRLRVLSRDNFRCVLCGRSPATDLGVRLHIDHILALSRGGKSVDENLQTLCEECNLGKRERTVNRP